jgi:hypothetical protein
MRKALWTRYTIAIATIGAIATVVLSVGAPYTH